MPPVALAMLLLAVGTGAARRRRAEVAVVEEDAMPPLRFSLFTRLWLWLWLGLGLWFGFGPQPPLVLLDLAGSSMRCGASTAARTQTRDCEQRLVQPLLLVLPKLLPLLRRIHMARLIFGTR